MTVSIYERAKCSFASGPKFSRIFTSRVAGSFVRALSAAQPGRNLQLPPLRYLRPCLGAATLSSVYSFPGRRRGTYHPSKTLVAKRGSSGADTRTVEGERDTHQPGAAAQAKVPYAWLLLGMLLIGIGTFAAVQFHALQGSQTQVIDKGIRFSIGPVVYGKALDYPRPWVLRSLSRYPDALKFLGFQSDLSWKLTNLQERLGLPAFAQTEATFTSFYYHHAYLRDDTGWMTMLWPEEHAELRPQHWAGFYVSFTSIPRHPSHFEVLLRDCRKSEFGPIVATYKITNPNHAKSATPTTTQTESLADKDRDIQVRLKQLKTGVRLLQFIKGLQETTSDSHTLKQYLAGNYELPANNELPATVGLLEVRERGELSDSYAINNVTLTDPYGIEEPLPHGFWWSANLNKKGFLLLGIPMLWTGEGAWNIKVELVRQRFPGGTSITLETVIPPPGEIEHADIALTTNMAGTSVTFMGISGANAQVSVPEGVHTFAHPGAVFSTEKDLVEFQPKMNATLTTDTAAPVITYLHDQLPSQSVAKRFRFGIYVGPGTLPDAGTSITLSFQLAEKRRFQFTATPEQVQAGEK